MQEGEAEKICDQWRSDKEDDVIYSAYDIIQEEKRKKTYSVHTIHCHASEINELIKKKEHLCKVPTF